MMRMGKGILKERCGKDLDDSDVSLIVEVIGIWLVRWLDGDPQALRKLTSSEFHRHSGTTRA